LITTEYASNYVYEGGVLQFFSTAEGYVEPKGLGWEYVFQYKDHLGNIRLSYADADGNGLIAQTEIREENNFYPFGLKHKGYNNVVTSTNPALKRKYNSKEFEEELGKDTYAYGWRDYDPAIGRFTKIDRFAEKYYSLTNYGYAGNNPIYFIDVQGDTIAKGSSTRKANRNERKENRRANKLDKTADRLDSKGIESGDLRERAKELRKSVQDIRDMRASTKVFKFASVSKNDGKPETKQTGDNEITLFVEGNISNQIHESRHGGQIARGEFDVTTGEGFGIPKEIDAYRAQFSFNGRLDYYSHNVQQTGVFRKLLNEKQFGFALMSISNINNIDESTVKDIGEVYFNDPSKTNSKAPGGFYILPLYDQN
jgi:RHS repeat-associated protein